jgi:RimJ/RimL family protein N-acetyltransferase
LVRDVPVIETERLILREWRDEDRSIFALINSDSRVMEHFPAPLTSQESDAFIPRIVAGWDQGFGLWALEERSTGSFIGFVGLSVPTWEAPFGSSVEIGWRLSFDAWGKGYATEAARRVMEWARTNVKPPRGELVSFTTVRNVRSRRVMEKRGFTYEDLDDFDHPLLPQWDARRHVLYRFDLSGT